MRRSITAVPGSVIVALERIELEGHTLERGGVRVFGPAESYSPHQGGRVDVVLKSDRPRVRVPAETVIIQTYNGMRYDGDRFGSKHRHRAQTIVSYPLRPHVGTLVSDPFRAPSPTYTNLSATPDSNGGHRRAANRIPIYTSPSSMSPWAAGGVSGCQCC